MTAPKTFPNRLREIRKKANVLQSKLAEVAGVSQAAICLAERTGKGLGEDKWQKIADYLETDVLILRGWTKVYLKP